MRNMPGARLALTLCAGALLLAGCGEPAGEGSQPSPPAMPDARAIHDAALVIDAHADIELPGAASRYADPDGTSKVAPDKMRAGGVDAVVLAAATGPGPRTPAGSAAAWQTVQAKLAAVAALAADPASQAVIARTADELEAAHASGRLAFILGFQNAYSLGGDIGRLDALYADGVRVFALTHMGHNAFADSSRPVSSSNRIVMSWLVSSLWAPML